MAVAASGGAALALAACDGSSKSPEATATSNSLLSPPHDTTSSARQGGTLRSAVNSDVASFDPHASQSAAVHAQIAVYTYPRLLKFANTKHPEKPKGETEGDLAESHEFSGDKLQLTLRIRQGLKWDGKAPVNGRNIEAQDVVTSWQRFTGLSPLRTDIAYDSILAPGAPVESVSSPDARTVIVKLKQPDASILALFASDRLFYVLPKEADGGFDPRLEVRGYGPYRLAENRPGFRSWSRNSEYHVKNRPLIDSIEVPIINDYASRLAQFKAGNIWTHVASQGDVLTAKEELDVLELRKADNYGTSPGSLAFGYDGDSPWKDERLRQAVSMLIDRETLIDVHTNRARFAANGLDFEVRYHTAIGAGWEGYWIDPKLAEQFGSSSRLFRFDPDEARRLMSAAGYSEGFESAFHFNSGGQYGAVYQRTVEMISGMLAAGGIRLRLEPHEFNDWLPNYHLAYASVQNAGKQIKGFNGLIYRTTTSYASVASQLFAQMHRDGSRFEGMTPDGKNAQQGDPDVNNWISNLRREFDLKRQQEMAQELARQMARKAYVIPNLPFSSLGFTLTWPVIANFGVYRGWPAGSPIAEGNLHLWIDSTKAPLSPY